MESFEGCSMRANTRVHVFMHDARTQGFCAIGVRARLWFCGARMLLAPSRRRKRTRHPHPPHPPLSVPRRQYLHDPKGASAPSARGASRPSPPALRRRRATRGAVHARAPRATSAPQLGQGSGESRPARWPQTPRPNPPARCRAPGTAQPSHGTIIPTPASANARWQASEFFIQHEGP